VAITGAGRGVGKEHAILFAKEGAKVIVNDVDADVAAETVAELKAMGAEAAVHAEDASTWSGGHSLIQCAVDNFGGLDTLVNNAGILRDRMTINMKEEEWDAVLKVHGKGTFIPTHAAMNYWKKCATEGKPRKGRIINTTSTSGIYGNVGQSNYAFAKAGIAAFSLVANAEAERLGAKINVLSPAARTRMTLGVPGTRIGDPVPEGQFDEVHPRNMAPVVVWFGSDSCDIGGCVVLVQGRKISVMEGWRPGKTAEKQGGPDVFWTPQEMNDVMPKLYAESEEHMMYKNMKAMAAAAAKAKNKAKL